jgi:hypothetical protein
MHTMRYLLRKLWTPKTVICFIFQINKLDPNYGFTVNFPKPCNPFAHRVQIVRKCIDFGESWRCFPGGLSM